LVRHRNLYPLDVIRGRSVEFALALGGALAVELGGTLFPFGTLLGLDRTPLARLRLLGVSFGDCSVLGRGFTLAIGFVLFLRRRHGVGLGLLLMPGRLTAKAFALQLALAATLLRCAARAQQQQGGDEHDGDHYGDYGNR
jgi:hypothetical protein